MKNDDHENRNRSIVISNDITSEVAKHVIEKIIEYNVEDAVRENKEKGFTPTPISIIINTRGGDIGDGFAIISAMVTSKTPVYTICFGRAMSMGFAIFAAGKKRFAHNLSIFMYHEVGGSSWGKLAEMNEHAKHLEMVMMMYDKIVLDYTNITKEKLDEVKNSRIDWYLTADDALKMGLVDELIK